MHPLYRTTDLNGCMHFLYHSSFHYAVVECRRGEYELVKNMSNSILTMASSSADALRIAREENEKVIDIINHGI